METDTTPKAQIIQLNEGAIRDHLGEMVRSTVEDTLNRMLDAEANQLCNARQVARVSSGAKGAEPESVLLSSKLGPLSLLNIIKRT